MTKIPIQIILLYSDRELETTQMYFNKNISEEDFIKQIMWYLIDSLSTLTCINCYHATKEYDRFEFQKNNNWTYCLTDDNKENLKWIELKEEILSLESIISKVK
jgi:hypothetical protein